MIDDGQESGPGVGGSDASASSASADVSEAVAAITPDDIDGGFAPNPRDSVLSSRFDDELLLVDSETGFIHVINLVGAVVWECFDGTVTLDELAVELADAYQAPLEVVRSDIVEMARQLGNRGLLRGVVLPMPELPPMPGLREVGAPLGPLNVRAPDGGSAVIPYPGSRGTFLVNWSPSCGYCANIVGDLEKCRAGLTERGIDLVLLTAGSDEDNRNLLEPAGLSDVAFYRVDAEDSEAEQPDDPFVSMGTPVAYLLDSDGKVEEPLAFGAAEVPRLARQAAGLVAESPEPPVSTAAEAGAEPLWPRPTLPAAGGMCGPTVGGRAKAPRQWAATGAYEIGEYRVGVRADSDRTDHLLARAFDAYRLEDGTPVDANFSVVIGGYPGTETRALNLLLVADTNVVRSRSPRRVLLALQARLSALLDTDNHGLLWTNTVAALAGGHAVLLPSLVMYSMHYLQPRLARIGVRLSDDPGAFVDPTTAELVIREPTITIGAGVLSELPEVRDSRSELAPMEPGRYPLQAWSFEESLESTDRLGRAASVGALLPAVSGSPESVGDLIDVVGQLTQKVKVIPLQWTSQRDLLQSIESRLIPAAGGTR